MAKKSFKELLKKSEIPVLVDFYADWCAPCRVVAPILQELASEMNGEIKIVKLNVDKNPTTSQNYQVQSIPTLILFDKGTPIWRKAGALPKNVLKKELQEALKKVSA